jgi:hypothetical protein
MVFFRKAACPNQAEESIAFLNLLHFFQSTCTTSPHYAIQFLKLSDPLKKAHPNWESMCTGTFDLGAARQVLAALSAETHPLFDIPLVFLTASASADKAPPEKSGARASVTVDATLTNSEASASNAGATKV